MEQLMDCKAECRCQLSNVLETQPRTGFRARDGRATDSRLLCQIALAQCVVHPPNAKVRDGDAPRCTFRHRLADLLYHAQLLDDSTHS